MSDRPSSPPPEDPVEPQCVRPTDEDADRATKLVAAARAIELLHRRTAIAVHDIDLAVDTLNEAGLLSSPDKPEGQQLTPEEAAKVVFASEPWLRHLDPLMRAHPVLESAMRKLRALSESASPDKPEEEELERDQQKVERLREALRRIDVMVTGLAPLGTSGGTMSKDDRPLEREGNKPEGQRELDEDRLTEALWDAREARDPSGGFAGEWGEPGEPVYWRKAEQRDLWPGSRKEQREEAKLVLELLRSGGGSR